MSVCKTSPSVHALSCMWRLWITSSTMNAVPYCPVCSSRSGTMSSGTTVPVTQISRSGLKGCYRKSLWKLYFRLSAQSARYGMRYSRRGDPRTTQSQVFGELTPLPHYTTHIINFPCGTEFFFGGDLDVRLVWFSTQRQNEVHCSKFNSFMEDPFFWYEWHAERILGFPIRGCPEVTLSGSNVVKWCVSVFPAVHARISHPEL